MNRKIFFSFLSVSFFAFGVAFFVLQPHQRHLVLGDFSDSNQLGSVMEAAPIAVVKEPDPIIQKKVAIPDVSPPPKEAISIYQDQAKGTIDLVVDAPVGTVKNVEYSATNTVTGQTTYLGTSDSPKTSFQVKIPIEKRLPNSTYRISADTVSSSGEKKTISGEKDVSVRSVKVGDIPKRIIPVKDGPTLEARDTDGDGLSDADEISRGTSVFSADTDGDGFLDGDEIKNGFNPVKVSDEKKGDKIVFESPKESVKKEKADDRFRVEKIERVKRADGKEVTAISGKGLPNTFVTVYIYSDPIVVTVKTDENGNWSYELDKEIGDGDHEVYVAVTDNVGRITAQSKPLPFVKTAQAINVKPQAARAQEAEGNKSPLEQSQTQFFAIGVTIIFLFLLIGVYVVGRRAQSEK